jgi:hypothetical protein
MSIPFHKQTDPNKLAGQVVFSPVAPNTKPELYLSDSHKQETTLAQYIERKTDEPKRLAFHEWFPQYCKDMGIKENYPHLSMSDMLYCWNAALTKGKL